MLAGGYYKTFAYILFFYNSEKLIYIVLHVPIC